MGNMVSYSTSSPPKPPTQHRLAEYVQALSPAENLNLIQSLAQGDSTKRAKCILLSDKGIDKPPFTLTRNDIALLVKDCLNDIGHYKFDELFIGALIEGIENQVKRDINQSGEVLGEGIGQLLDLASLLIKGRDCEVCRIRGSGDKVSLFLHDKFVQAIKDLDKFGYQRECKWLLDGRRTYALDELSGFDDAYRSFAFRLDDHQGTLVDSQYEAFDEMWCKESHAGCCACWEDGKDWHGKPCDFYYSRC